MFNKGQGVLTVFFLSLVVLNTVTSAAPRSTAGLSSQQIRMSKAAFSKSNILIKFKKGALSPLISTSGPSNIKSKVALSRGNNILSSSARNILQSMGVNVVKTYNKVGMSSAHVSGDVGVAIEKLLKSGLVEYAEPDYIVKASAIPNDPSFGDQWGLHNGDDIDIDAPAFWNKRKTAMTSIVGIIDSGVDYNHEDLNVNMWENPGEIAGDGIDNDGNGYIDDVYGINAAYGTSDPMDDNSHGTHVAGTIGARGNNNKGVTGVAWRTRLMALKFLDSSGSGYTSSAIESINYAIAIKVANSYSKMVLNNSWGGGGYSQALYDAINAAKNKEIIFVAAAGNDSVNVDHSPHYPSSYNLENIISVGASNSSEQLAYFSNYGCSEVDVIAPGESILSTTPGNTYSFFSGTSMAAPHVSGMAAMLWSHKNTSWRRIKAMLMNGSEANSSYLQKSVTQGRVNLNDSLNAYAKPAIFSITPAVAASGDTVTIRGQDFGSTAGTLQFDGVAIPTDSWVGSKIVFTVPQNITYNSGKLTVTKSTGVVTPAGACFTLAIRPTFVGNTIFPRAWSTSAQTSGSIMWILGGRTPWVNVTGAVERVVLGPVPRTTIDSSWFMPIPVSNATSAATSTKIFVFGGLNASEERIDSVQIFDIPSESWSFGSNLPEPLSQASATRVGGKIIVVGGRNDLGDAVDSTYIYDIGTDVWSTGAVMPAARAYSSSFQYASTNRLWTLGGFNNGLGSETQSVYEYNLSANSWGIKPDLISPRAAFVGVYHYKPQVISGVINSIFGGVNDVYEIYSNGSWTSYVTDVFSLYKPEGGKRSGYLYYMNGYSNGFRNNIFRVKK